MAEQAKLVSRDDGRSGDPSAGPARERCGDVARLAVDVGGSDHDTASGVAECPLARRRSGSGIGGARTTGYRAGGQLLVGVCARAVALARQRLRLPARPRLFPDPEGVPPAGRSLGDACALAVRALTIGVGAVLLETFAVVTYVLGAVLLLLAGHMLRS